MVILPYKDRLALFSKYLQQLVMESLGKERISTAKSSIRESPFTATKARPTSTPTCSNFATACRIFSRPSSRCGKTATARTFEVEPGVTSGDYLQGFLRGTRAALYEGGRDSITISIPEVDAFHVGALIALYERAVGFYGSLVNINAYHQPGVEAGKKAATRILQLQPKVLGSTCRRAGKTAEAIAHAIDADPEEVFHVLRHLAANDPAIETNGDQPGTEKFSRIE